MTNAHRHIQVEEEIAHMAADFFARESEVGSLVTVTHADVSPKFTEVVIYLSVLPQTQEGAALQAAKRQRTDFREYLKKHGKFHPIPTVDFEIDYGEKNRQRIDELTRKKIA